MAGIDVGANLRELQKQQDALQKTFRKDKAAFYKAQKTHDDSKAKLSAFDTKYGRVLQLLGE